MDENDEKTAAGGSSSVATASFFTNTLLASVILIGLGSIGGFGIFHAILHHRFVAQIDRTEQTHNNTLSIIRDRYIETDRELKQCAGETDGLRGRLDAQHKTLYDLTAAQRSLSGEHQELRDRFQRDQQAMNDLQIEHQELQAGFRRDQQVLNDLQAEHQELQAGFRRDQESLNDLRAEHQELRARVRRDQESLNNMQAALEQKDRDLSAVKEQKDSELSVVKNKSEILIHEKYQLEQEVAGLKNALDGMQAQLEAKDEEISAHKQEEGTLEEKLNNLRTGMLDLLKERLAEIQNLRNQVDVVNQEKEDLELKLDNWREGMLGLVRDKQKEIEGLKADLVESKESMKGMMAEIDDLNSDRAESEQYMKGQLDAIQHDPDQEEESTKKILGEIEELKADLEESQQWITEKTNEIESLKLAQAESQELIGERMNEIEELKSDFEYQRETLKENIFKLESDLTEARELLKKKTTEAHELETELAEFVTEINALKSSPSDLGSTTNDIMINHVQQRDSVMCRQLFGKGPYYVKFVIRLPASQQSVEESNKGGADNTVFFVIEISTRKHLPHSIYTFLTLVESNLYDDGAAFLSTRNGGLQIGSAIGSIKTLETKLKPLGMPGGSALSFLETSTSGKSLPCGLYSFGFIHRGPGLNLFLSSKSDNDVDCFAQVIRGQDILSEIQSSLMQSEEPVEIVSVKHLRVD